MNRPPIIGIVMTPDIVGDLSRASWKYCEKNTVPEYMPTPTNSDAAEARAIVRLRNRRSGMIGALALVSVNTNSSASTIVPPTIVAVCHDSQSYLSSAKVTQSSSSEAAAVMKKAPAQSILTSRLATGRCRVFCSTSRAIRAKGIPTKRQ